MSGSRQNQFWVKQGRPAGPRRLHLAGLGLALLILVALTAPLARAATITVNTTADEDNTDGDCSLREAIIAANTDQAVDACGAGSGADTIILPAGDYVLTIAGTLEGAARTGDLDITDDLIITGAGRGSTTIDGNGLDRVFQISANSVQISGVTITGGDPGGGSGGGLDINPGSSGVFTLINSRITNNTASSGGGLYGGSGTLTLINSRVDHNTAQNSGGGIITSGTATKFHINNSVINSNIATSGYGGGIQNGGTMTLVNSTVSGNSAAVNGGGILTTNGDSTSVSLFNTTITNNTADSDNDNVGEGGGVTIATGTLNAKNSIIGRNFDNSDPGSQHPDCSGTFTSGGYNLLTDTTGCTITGDTTGNVTGVLPRLTSLRNNGGQTLTHALLADSPAIDAGNPTGCLDQNSLALTTDQRDFIRPVDGDEDGTSRCDIGAYEYDSPGPPPPTATPTRTATLTATATLTQTATPTATATPSQTATPQATTTPNSTPPITSTITVTLTPPADYSVYLPLIQK